MQHKILTVFQIRKDRKILRSDHILPHYFLRHFENQIGFFFLPPEILPTKVARNRTKHRFLTLPLT